MGQFLPTFKKKVVQVVQKVVQDNFYALFFVRKSSFMGQKTTFKKKVGKKCPIDFGLKSEKIRGVVELTTPLIIPLNTLSQELNEQPNQP